MEITDREEGSLCWLEGKRMDWAAYSREEPMVEVNNVTVAYLVISLNRALSIGNRKARKNALEFNLKRLIYKKSYLEKIELS